ncbi:MAG: DUF2203 domain-containing protein [Chloroflexi bacterium]|nr:DUF2203 domain-containing protein [Chloroflexota bacterium]
MRPQRFTQEEANALLPRLSDILLQIQESKVKHDQLQEKAAEYAQRMSSNGHVIEKELNETRQELEQAATALNSLIERVRELGCEVKDIDQGLVDFRTVREGREVYLCWKLGEPDVRWWHELETGFAGRRPLGSDA